MNAVGPPQPTTHFVDLPERGGRMAVLDFGPPTRPADIVFSHANGFNALTYRSILQPLAADLRILAIDLRGHGATELPTLIEGREGWQEMGDDLLAFLASQLDHPVVLAGHSMGGTTSLLAAAESPQAVRSLVLLDPVIVPGIQDDKPGETNSSLVEATLRRRSRFPSREAAVLSYRGRGAFRTWSDVQLEDYLTAGLKPDGDELALACAPEWEASNYRTHNYDPMAAFTRSLCPIHLLKAGRESTTRLDDRELAALGADGRIVVETLPGTTHFLPMERPEAVREALRAAAAG